MTNLGFISLRHSSNLLPLRRKTYEFLYLFGLTDIQATRIASATYEIASIIESNQSSVHFFLIPEKKEVMIEFRSPNEFLIAENLQAFFQSFHVTHSDNIFIYNARLHDSSSKALTSQLIMQMVSTIEHQSKEELFEEIQEQNNALEEARNDLEQKVVRRTKDLEAASSQAEAANRAKSLFLSSMSHELRTPLNGVLGYVQILQKDKSLNRDHKNYLDSISNCGHHLLTLINDILDLSKIEAGKLELNWQTVTLSSLLKSVQDIVRPRAEAHGLKLIFEADDDLPELIKIDPTKLRQVLVNLLGNSVKFTESGYVKLKTSKVSTSTIKFAVEDTGIGIQKENLDAIFSPFQQDEGGRKAGGTGLGLSISKNLIQAFGGELSVESTYGKGSTFSFELPLQEINQDEIEEVQQNQLDESDDFILDEKQDIEVLIVDDIGSNREVLGQALKLLGFQTSEAHNGRVALEMASKKHYPVIFMDIRMPEMDGYESTRLIRKESLCQDSVIILLTASVVDEEITEAKKHGFNDGLGKPFKIQNIFNSLRRHTNFKWIRVDHEPELNSIEPN